MNDLNKANNKLVFLKIIQDFVDLFVEKQSMNGSFVSFQKFNFLYFHNCNSLVSKNNRVINLTFISNPNIYPRINKQKIHTLRITVPR